MPKSVTLGSGEVASLKDRFIHAAERASYDTLNRGAVEKEYLDEGKSVRETPVSNFRAAEEAALLVMIESVKKGDADVTVGTSWLGELDENDYGLLVETMVTIRREGRERGKKNL